MVTKSSATRIPLGDGGFGAPGVFFDQRRTRTAWFEGQHVTADQFNRDQSYHVTRQSDLGRTIGRGVVEGFEVTATPGSETTISVAPGLGLAASGEVIVLPEEARIDLAEIPVQRRLDAMFKAPGKAVSPPETRTGLFVLAASTVEYSSNPVGSYPVSATSSRTLEDSVINEAVLFTLTPYPVPGTRAGSEEWRSDAAYGIFVSGAEPELPAAALPIAMLALIGNKVLWVDVPMVRRHCAPASGDIFGLGLVDQTRRIAHFEQFEGVIGPVIRDTPAAAMPASGLVRALPPMGRLPVGSVALRAGPGEPERLSQNWLPAVVPCELVALPEDEIEALLRESVHLPPIDLSAHDEVLKNIPVSVIVPVPRAAWAATPAEVAEAALSLVPPPAVGGTPTDPAALLDALLNGTVAPSAGDMMLTAEWRALLGRAPCLWYARRRQFQRSDDPVAGQLVILPEPEVPDVPPAPDEPPVTEAMVVEMVQELANGQEDYFNAQGAGSMPGAETELGTETALRLLTRQERLRAAGAHGTALALILDVIRQRIKPGEALKTYSVESGIAYAAIEPMIIGAGLHLRLDPSEDADPRRILEFVTGLGAMPQDLAEMALKQQLPFYVALRDWVEPEPLAKMLDSFVGANIPGAFETLPTFGKDAVEARMKMTLSGAVGPLGHAFVQAASERRPKLLLQLREAFLKIGDPEEMGREMINIVRVR